jgi:hypothetical protein
MSWGVKVSGNLDETTHETGKTVFVQRRDKAATTVTLGEKVTSWNGGRASVYRVASQPRKEDVDRLRAEAEYYQRQVTESQERSDTDGFLSQWASGMNAQLRSRQAEIAEHGGLWTFERTILEHLDGTPVEGARLVHTRYGDKWRIDATDEWLPYRPARVGTLARKGYREINVQEIAPARAEHWAPPGAKGLSGATSVQTIIRRHDRSSKEGWRPVGPLRSRRHEAPMTTKGSCGHRQGA